MKKRLLFCLLLMGFTSLVVQVLLIREFLVCFYGNELTIGLILGNWIILEALGSGIFSRIGQTNKKPFAWYAIFQCLIALYFPIAIYLTRSVKNFLPLTIGEGVGPLPILIVSFLILAPLSIFDGAQFPLGCRLWRDYSKKSPTAVGSVYIFEAIGFIIAGPIFTYIFLTRLHAFHIALILSCLNLWSALLLVQKESKPILRKILSFSIITLLCSGVIALLFGFSNHLNKQSLKQSWRKYHLIDSQNSIYGNLAVTKEKEQYTFFTDGIPFITTPVPDIITNEEFIHFGMLSHPHPAHALIIGGGAGGPLAEILKYPFTQLDYAELDPLLIQMIKEYSTPLTQKELSDPRLSIKITDGARYIATTKKRYDIIFINLPIPTTLQLNRFYIKDFFVRIHRTLEDRNGLFVFKLPGSLSYLNEELKKLNLSILDTLKEVFPSVEVIPGDFNLFLASKSPITISPTLFIERLQERAVQTRVLTPRHIEYRLNTRWRDWFYASLAESPPVNTNSVLVPKGLFYALTYWNSLFSPRINTFFREIETLQIKTLLICLAIMTVLLMLVTSITKRSKQIGISYAILTTGIFGMAFDLIIIFVYQSFYGYVFHHIALLITAFMVGLTLGGWLMTKHIAMMCNKKRLFVYFEGGLLFFSLAMIPVLANLGKSQLNLSFVFFLLSGILGFLVGSEFPLANSLFQTKKTTQTAGLLYALDLLGSWIGALAVSVILIPVIGLAFTCIFLAALKLSCLLLLTVIRS